MIDEREIVRKLGDTIGYGRMMQLAQELWREVLAKDNAAGGEHTVGPCAALTVPCPHPGVEHAYECDVCCGCGRITQWVADRINETR